MTDTATGPLPASVIEALGRYDTPTICNAMEIVAPERRLIVKANVANVKRIVDGLTVAAAIIRSKLYSAMNQARAKA